MGCILPSLALAALAACAPGQLGKAHEAGHRTTGKSALVASVSGSIPTGLPARLLVGLFEDTGQTWMKDSGVRWDVRYRYFVKGWIDNWGWGPGNGQWGLRYLRECDAQGFIPAVQPLGLAPNVTGATWDVLVGDPLDRDAEFYRRAFGQDRWRNPSDSAPITSKSFNRYAEWLRLWNVTSGKRWVLWQIPLGNSHHLNVDNTRNAPREGYQDNRAEYFFGPGGAANREKFARSGVLTLLFGKGEGRQSSYTNDYYKDGKLFMKSRAGAFLKAGGLAISASGSPPKGGAVTGPPPPPPPAPNPPSNPVPPPRPLRWQRSSSRAAPRGGRAGVRSSKVSPLPPHGPSRAGAHSK